jgi:4-amino-4-deoxy-L-arabinose transferase-like glycosyltransferase
VALALAAIVVVYLASALAFSMLTRAGEASDELDHVQYVEHLLQENSFPRIGVDNGHESDQPPLYYLAAAAWQKALGIHPFQLVLGPATRSRPGVGPLELSHAYTHAQRQAAGHVHVLRLLSVLFGLGTVLLTFAAARLATGRDSVALAASLTVALWPKEAFVSAAVTNDSLVIMLGSACLVLLLLWLRGDTSDGLRARLLAFDLGLVLGAAVLTKLSALFLVPLAVLVMVAVALGHRGHQRVVQLVDPLLTIVGFMAVTGWWLARNQHLYGGYLTGRASTALMRRTMPRLVSHVSWFNANRFLQFVPSSLQKSVWYDGGWNQLLLPGWVNKVLTAVAAYALAIFIVVVARRRSSRLRPAVTAALVGGVVAGLAAVMSMAKDQLQAEARIAFIGLSAFAIILVIGVSQAGPLLLRRARPRDAGQAGRLEAAGLLFWPVVFLAVDLYVFAHFVLPTHGP